MIIKKKEAENILEDLTSLHTLWLRMKQFLLLSFTNNSISSDIEYKFLEVKSNTTKYLRVIAEKIDPHQFKYEPTQMSNLLRQAISISHLRGLPLADRKNLLILWHEVLIHLSQVLGAFLLIKEGYQPKKKERKGTTIAALKRGASDSESKKKKKGDAGKAVFIVILLLIVAGVVFVLMNR